MTAADASAKHETQDACECDVDYNCGRHAEEEARLMADAQALVRGAVRAGIILPAGVEREMA